MSLSETNYTIDEATGFIEVCVVLDGIIERNIKVQLSTLNGSASGNHQ